MDPRKTSFVLALLAAMLVASGALASDPVRDGPEIQVSNSYAAYIPRIASDPQGNFLVVWEEYEAIQGRRFFANGNEAGPQFELSETDHYIGSGNSTSTGNVAVAADPVGSFVVTYTASDYTYVYYGYPSCYFGPCLWARRNLESGGVGSAFTIQDPTQTYVYKADISDQVSNPEITNLSNGEFVIVWEGYDYYEFEDSPGSFGAGESTFAAKTTKIGQRKGSAFRVNAEVEGYQGQYGDFAAASDANDRFVIVYRDENDYSAPGGTLRVQRYDDKAKPEGDHFGVSSGDLDGDSADIAQAADGTFMVVWNASGGLYGRVFQGDGTPVTSDITISNDRSEYPAVAASDDAFIVVWTDDEVMAKRFDLTGTATSTEFQVNTTLDGYWADVAASPSGDFTVTWKSNDGHVKAQQFRTQIPGPVEHRLSGKSFLLKNVVPDNPAKNKAKWKSSMQGIPAPGRGTDGDPRCLGKPSGTVNAVLRFVSSFSGHDSGAIPLPCQNWIETGSSTVSTVQQRGYRYQDPTLVNGPCNQIIVTGNKSLNVSCKGKKNVVDFLYDLEVGTSEGTVTAILEMGPERYCAAFPPFKGADGSDGKKFKGKNSPAPVACEPGYFTLGQCGNSVIGYDEACDDGNTLDGDLCSADCKRETAICGDGTVGYGEACDDGNNLDGDYCSGNCLFETAICGDGEVGPGEACDDSNTLDGDYCSANCNQVTAICGDGMVGPGEACDDSNTLDGDYCSADCTAATAVCGDGTVGPGECCDDANTTPGDGCEATCDSGALCPPCDFLPGDFEYCLLDQCGPCDEGIGDCDYDSECAPGLNCIHDIGARYGYDPIVDVCKQVVCGDGIREGSEVCDDGNTVDGDYCSADCSQITSVCGDGTIGPGEACDDSNTVDGDLCSADCSQYTSICGDGIITLGECCDDGNAVGGDTCDATCDGGSACHPCGLLPGDYEYCKLDQCGPCPANIGDCDSNAECIGGTVCVNNIGRPFGWDAGVDVCAPLVCGDGIRVSPEVCDDGNTVDGDYCSADCSQITSVCGDGTIGPGEACDDSNTVDGDLCSADCSQFTSICGDGIITLGECCDDGNAVGGDTCDATCDGGSACHPCGLLPGDYEYCNLSNCGPCPANIGDCDSNAECSGGTVCVDNIGNQFGWDGGVDVCQ